MSRCARDWAWTLQVTPPQKLVLLALSEHADDEGDCWPSLTRLSALTGLVRSTVAQALGTLEADGVISRERGERGRSTRYRLRMSGPDKALRGPAHGRGCAGGRTGDSPLDRPPASPGDGPGRGAVVRETDQGSPPDGPSSPGVGPAASPGDGLVREPVVRETDQGSPSGGPSSPADGLAVVRETDPNRQLNRQEPSMNRHCSAAAPNAVPTEKGRSRGTATRIPPQWRPGERVFVWAAKQDMAREWVEDQIDEFVVYWSDRGDRRKSWDATFMNRLRSLQAQQPTGTSNATCQPLVAKDYRKGATPLEEIPWLNAAALG